MATYYQNINTVATASAALADGDKIPLIQSNTLKTCTIDKLIAKAKDASLTAFEAQYLDLLTEGCYIATTTVRKTTRFWQMFTPSAWVAAKKDKATAEGVLITDSGHRLLVANTSKNMKWSSKAGLVTDAVTRASAFNDWAGKEKTKAISTSSIFASDTANNNAAKYCAAYSTAHVKAGSWWLPSFAELWMVALFRDKINAMRALLGYDKLIFNLYSTSTEISAGAAFDLSIYDLLCTAWNGKTEGSFTALPVSSIDNGFLYGQSAND